MKQFRLKIANDWIRASAMHTAGSRVIEKLTLSGIDLEKELSKMNSKQLKIISSLMAASYSHGSDSTRKTISMIRGRKPVPSSCHLRVVV